MEIYIHKTHGWQCKKINDKNKLRAVFEDFVCESLSSIFITIDIIVQ